MPQTFSFFPIPSSLHKPFPPLTLFLPHISSYSPSYVFLPSSPFLPLPLTFKLLRSPPPSLLLLPLSYPLPLHTATPFYSYTPFYSPIDSPYPLTSLYLPLSLCPLLPLHTFILYSPYILLGHAQFLIPTIFTSFTPITHNPSLSYYSQACTQATSSNCLFPNFIWTPFCLESFLLYLRISISPAPF